MPALYATPGISSIHLNALARSKAAKECQRPEHDLHRLLAHIKILDQLEHNQAEEIFESRGRRQKSSSSTRSDELERGRPGVHRKTASAASTGEAAKHHVLVAPTPSTVTVEECDDDDWDA